jgi:predicted acyltransferase
MGGTLWADAGGRGRAVDLDTHRPLPLPEENLSAPMTASPAIATVASEERMLAVDVLRGFDMFWIMGADSLVGALNKASGGFGPLKTVATQLEHVEWAGFHFYDLIFPMFVFIIGVSITLSLDRIVEKEGKPKAYQRIVRRGVLLYLLGLLYYGGIGAYTTKGIRFVGVLHRLAFSYFFTSLLYMNLRMRGLIIGSVAILIGYWAALTFIPATVPGFEPKEAVTHATYAPGQNLTNWIDYYYLPGRKWDKTWDPEGLLSNIPAVATCILGVLAGMLLKNTSVPKQKKVFYLAGAGVAMVALGYLWGIQFPIIKKLWTSTFVLVAGGYSCLLLAAFYQILDIWGYRKWATPFVWIGSNALAIYMLGNFVDFDGLARRFTGGPIEESLGNWGTLLTVTVSLLLAVLLTRWMYKKRLFIKV